MEEILNEILTIKRLVNAAPRTTPTVAPARHATILDAIRLDMLDWKVSRALHLLEYHRDIEIPQFVLDARERRQGAEGMYIIYSNVRLPDHAPVDTCSGLTSLDATAGVVGLIGLFFCAIFMIEMSGIF